MRLAYLLALCSSAAFTPTTTRASPVPSELQNILSNTHGSGLYRYPTDLTRGIVPKPLHSHNDYWRDVPYWSALSVGAISVEADVWLVNGTLYVGHEISALTEERTFDALYVQPILKTIQRQNPTTPFISSSDTQNGVFDTDSGQTLYFWIDLKTEGTSTLAAVLTALEPLRAANYLTTVNTTTGSRTDRQVTVIGTGNTPESYFTNSTSTTSSSSSEEQEEEAERFIFYDANLALLSTTQSTITPSISVIASTQFSKYFGPVRAQALNDTQLATLREQVSVAHGKGIKVRYWDLPAWPVGTRNAVWRTLWDEGVDLVNVDDLSAAAGFWEGRG